MKLRRPPSIARRGMVVAAHPLAVEAGVEMLRSGGHAVDAVVAAAAVLSVIEPSASGLGGDAFLLIYDRADGAVAAVNGSGAAPRELDSVDAPRQTGSKVSSGSDPTSSAVSPALPQRGPLALTVPGCVAAWDEASYGWGRLDWDALLAPAVRLAEEGFAVSLRMAGILRHHREALAADPGLAALFLRLDGTPLPAGAICRPTALAKTLKGLAAEGPESFYRGAIARRLVRGVREAGGALSADDLERHESDLRSPLEYALATGGSGPGDLLLVEQPLPTQGILLPLAAGMLEILGPTDGWLELHRQVEAMKIAFVVRDLFLGDPLFLPVPEEDLAESILHPATLNALASLIGDTARETVPRGRTARRRQASGAGDRREEPLRNLVLDRIASAGAAQGAVVDAYRRVGMLGGDPGGEGSDTTYLCAADAEGNVAGLIQSIFHPFGGGFLEPSTGIILNNRGAGFSPDPRSPNRREPGKRARHTLNSWMLLRGGEPWITGGTPGAHNQVPVNLQVVRSVLAGGPPWPGPAPMVEGGWSQARRAERDPVEPVELAALAIEAPRWDFDPGGRVRLEARMPAAVRQRLRRAGHDPVRGGPWDGTGFAQAIEFLEGGAILGVTDPRGEGAALGL